MKKTRFIIIGLSIAGSLFYYDYSSKYSIDNNIPEIEEEIEKRLESEIEIKKTLLTNNKLHFVFDMSGVMGSGEFRKGWNNKYKFEFVGHGTNSIRERIIETNKGQYLKIAGRNTENIGEIKAYIDDEIYDIEIPDGEYFLVLEPVKKTEIEFTNAKIIFDREGNEIYRLNLPEE
ncbi:hypothetical protein D3C76_1375600 [compost metagenome]